MPDFQKIFTNMKLLGPAFLILLCVACAATTSSAQGTKASPSPTPTPEAKKNERPAPTPAAEPFDTADVKTMASKCVRLETEAGDIELEFFPESAPETVRSYLNLVATGMFDTTTFSRVVPNFVIQGGDLYTRTDKVTYAIGQRARKTVPDEPSKILHERGIISMARGDEPNAATTNFFILVKEAPYLDGKFAAFGRVTKGMEVVDTINKAPVTEEKPEKPVRIKKATVYPCSQ
jgi:peptidyl-prolyl cis-trans isomerase B (cyclophilin B)